MTKDRKKIVAWTLSIILGLVFILAAVMKFDYAPYLEKDIGKVLGTRGTLVAILARCLIAFELGLGLALLQPNWRKRIVIPLCLVTLGGFSIYLATLDPNLPNCGCLGNWPPMTPLESLFKNLVLGVMAVAAWVFSPKDPKGTVLAPALGLVASVGLIFAIIPPTDNITDSDGMDMTVLGPFHNQKVSATEGLTLVCFLNSTCEHCEAASMDLQDFHLKYGMPVFFVLHGTDTEVRSFFEMTGTEGMPWQTVKVPFFLSAVGDAPPRYHLVKDGKSIAYWDGKFDEKAVVEAVKRVARGGRP